MGNTKLERAMRSLAAGALVLAAAGAGLASPIAPGRTDEIRYEGAADPADRRWIGEALQEVRRAGPVVTPSLLGIDDGVVREGAALGNELLRDPVPIVTAPWTTKAPARAANGNADLFQETLDDAMRATRDALFEGNDTANFSLAGIELSVTVRGNRRGVSVNGQDVLSQVEYAVGSDMLAPPPMAVSAPKASSSIQPAGDRGERFTLADIRKIIFHPMAITVALALVILWAVLGIIESARARRS